MSRDEDVRFDVDHPVRLRMLAADTVTLQVRSLAVAEQVELTGTVDVAVWSRLYDSGSLHLDGEPAPVGFDPSAPVRLVLRLRQPFAARLAGPEELLRALLGDAPSPLHETEAWHALEATQRLDVPDTEGAWVEVGIRTRFADPI